MFKKIFGFFFGRSDKGVVSEVSDAVDRWKPSPTSRHRMAIEDLQAGDESQDSARKMELRSHDTWFDVLVDGLNRLVRPVLTFWAIGILFGIVPTPIHWATIHPMVWNILWTIVTFWFGSRVIFKDIPSIWKSMKK